MKKIILILIICSSFLPQVAGAFSLVEDVGGSCMGKGSKGNCTICDVLTVVFNAARFVFMSMAGIALIMIVVSSIVLILNMGNSERVASSKKMIINTIIAVVIIMVAWTLVNALILFLAGSNTQLFNGGSWWVGPACN